MSKKYSIKFTSLDRGILLISWPNSIDRSINQSVLHVASSLRILGLNEIIDIVPAYNSLAIFFDADNLELEFISSKVNSIFNLPVQADVEDSIVEIPVCYDEEFGTDIKEICEYRNISVKELILLHSRNVYRVYFLGFLPGFMYLGDLDLRIQFPRRKTPRALVPAGAVGIGGNQTGIYPIQSPGGWNLIGRCPLNLWDIRKSVPSRIRAGDQIQFVEIDKMNYFNIHKREFS